MTELTINGRSHQLEAELDTPLLWVLRDFLGLRGTKYGCGKGLCGACTVHLGGRAVRSCQVSLGEVKGREVVTIEGLSVDASHPVQQAWREGNVPQCGYCQSGQIMTAVALLRTSPNPGDQEIDEAMAGNLCRCGTYPRIRSAIKHAAKISGGKA